VSEIVPRLCLGGSGSFLSMFLYFWPNSLTRLLQPSFGNPWCKHFPDLLTFSSAGPSTACVCACAGRQRALLLTRSWGEKRVPPGTATSG
jgi:hypothetical protein